MSNGAGSVQGVLVQVGRALEPLARELEPGRARVFFAELGVSMTGAQEAAVASALATTATAVRDLLQLVSELTVAIDADDTAAVLGNTAGVVQNLVGAFGAVDGLVGAFQGAGIPLPPAVLNAIPERMLNALFVRALEPAVGVNEILQALGVLDQQAFNTASVDPDNPPYSVSTFDFGSLGDWLESPGTAMTSLYGWNTPGFDGVEVLRRLGELLAAVGGPTYFDDASVPPKLDLLLLEITPKTDVNPKGFQITLRAAVETGTVGIGKDDWKIEMSIGGQVPFGTALVVQPTGVTVVPPAAAGTIEGEGTVKFIADRTNATDGYVLLGSPGGGSKLEIRKFELGVEGRLSSQGGTTNASGGVAAAVSGGKLVVSMSDADGFIGTILSGLHLESDFDFGMGFSSEHGLYFTGSSGLEIQLPLHVDLGPVSISALTFSVGIDGQSFPTAIAVDLNATLGPLAIVVEQIGLKIEFELVDDRSGNAGPLDVSLGFKPPRGAGLSIDTGLVKGGGYLAFDADKGEYAGVAELSIAGIVTVKALGLITTKMPDGSQGFSLLIIISAEFTPLQLGFGFTLIGVGGLLGLNRTVLFDVLRDGIRTGSVNSIMFPVDVVANAPRIISDLRAVFPVEEGTFLVGPMAKFGWGTPALITLSLGVIVEIPPGNIAVLGILKVALPDEDVALIKLQVNFLGVLDFDRKMFSFDASLFDSRVLFLTMEGDMAVRLTWGDNAAFLLSVGGFHPSFEPPPLDLPTLRRISIRILDFSWARIRIDSYFAVTSNTVQFGSRSELFFGVDGCNVSGHIGYDVLFQFSPFHFIAQLSGSLNLEVIGIDVLSIHLRFSLEGPTPWRAKGTGSVSLFFFDVDVDFDVTWGDRKDTSLPPVAVLPIVVSELNKQENWRALPPATSNLLVSLRTLDPTMLVLHPFGALTVSQRAVPLALTIDKVGSKKPEDANRVDITAAASGGVPFSLTVAEESFAPAQYQDMTDAEKLSRPSYQKLKGGVIIGASHGPKSSKMTRRKVAYEVTIIDKEPLRLLLKLKAITGLFVDFLSGASIARSSLSFQTRKQLGLRDDTIVVASEGFTVASIADNSPIHAAATFSSEAMARDHMNEQVAADPALAGSMHVLPTYEVSAS